MLEDRATTELRLSRMGTAVYRRHGNKLGLVFLAGDLAVTTLAWLAAYWTRFGLFPSPEGIPDFHLVLEALPLVLVLATVSYRLAGLYEIHRLREMPRELGVVFRAGRAVVCARDHHGLLSP